MSKFATIRQHIVNMIESGRWPQYSKVPSENDLATQFGVSRMTARRALQELAQAGILRRSRGRGTFVAPFKSQASVLTIRNIADEIAEQGGCHRSEVLQLQPCPASPEVAEALALDVGQQVFSSLICHYRDGCPIQLEQRYVHPALVPDYLHQDFSLQTPHEYLSQVAPLTRARHWIEAVLAPAAVCNWLDIAPTQPCLLVRRLTRSRQGAVSFALLYYPGNRYCLGGELVFSSSGESHD